MEGVQCISINDLLRRRRPISGAVSLLHSQPSITSPSPFGDSKTQNPNSSSHAKILKSLSEPSMIVGIISLPILDDTLSSNTTSPHFCFSFSDGSASICCDVLDFDIHMISKKINVLAWNFIPFKHRGGATLEIVKWEFREASFSGNVNSFPLGFEGTSSEKDCDKIKAKYSVFGVLGSVSPVSFVPCSNESSLKNIHGFTVEILSCDCNLCKSINLVKNSENVVLERDAHRFSRSNYVYFCGISSSWYPMFLRLTGKVLLLSGMRKKLVYIGKEEAELMFVSTELTCLHVWNLHSKQDGLLQTGKARVKGKGELSMYIGVVTKIHMQGMIVELDEKVWLLLTDDSLLLPHSVRVGSLIYVRNVHILSPNFSWGKIVVLGACCKSNICTISFSALETGCQLKLSSSSLLGKFMESLVFPARLWVLLLVQCFRKKFSGAFSEKEILGTKYKEGLVQTYARYILHPSTLQSRHDIFTEFCKHDSCGSGFNSYCSLSLAMPFSYLIYQCERICLKSLLQMKNCPAIFEGCSQVGHLFLENRLSDQPIRRIFPSKHIGVSLLGNLKCIGGRAIKNCCE